MMQLQPTRPLLQYGDRLKKVAYVHHLATPPNRELI